VYRPVLVDGRREGERSVFVQTGWLFAGPKVPQSEAVMALALRGLAKTRVWSTTKERELNAK